MNTNAKHYEVLKVQPWDIMEKNFTTEEFVAYLKGNIIKYTLRDKGQAVADAEKIKHYAEKLIEVLEKKETDEFLEEDAEHIYGEQDEPEEAVDEPEEAIDEHKFKVGDRVEVIDKTIGKNRKATVIHINERRPTGKSYIVELDAKGKGWKSYKHTYGVDSQNAWFAYEEQLELLNERTILLPNYWYDASLYTVEELEKVLPVGTKVIVMESQDNDRKVDFDHELVREATVTNIAERLSGRDTRIGISNSIFLRRYFKIIKED